MPIGKIEQFDLSNKKWSAYIRRVEQFIALNEIRTELQVATLVTVVGEATYDLMCDLCAPDNPETKTFQQLVNIVSDHLEPKRSDIAERHVFRQRRQKTGECLSEYLQALKHLASTCNFQNKLEENLRDQFVSGLCSDDMRSRLFAEPTLTYKRAVELALALEAADRHAQASGSSSEMRERNQVAAAGTEPLHRVATARPRTPRPGGLAAAAAPRATNDSHACWRCGRNHRSDLCRFKNYSCDSCGQKGHLRIMCKNETASRLGNKRREHFYMEDNNDESDCDFYNLSVCSKDDKPYRVQVRVHGISLTFELDTGSKLSTINLDCYKKYFNKIRLMDNDICLRSYTGGLIKPLGYIQVDVVLGKHTACGLKLFVIENGGPPLFGRSWLRQLKIDIVAINDLLLHLMKNIYKYVVDGWPSGAASDGESPYFNRMNSISLDSGCLLYNHRVIIPEFFRRQILKELHEGHLGVVKMKNIARSFVYWPQIDTDIENLCRECSACNQQRDSPPRAALHPWTFPARPWQRIHIDFAEFQGKHYLVTVDAHSKWIEVQKMSTTTASATVLKLREQFARFGLPTQVVSDGGPPFSSSEFADFMSKNYVTHTITSPYRAAGNGAAENAVKSVKRAMKKALHEGMNVDTAIIKFLFQYRNCAHATTGVSPAEAMLGKRLRSRLDAVKPSLTTLRVVEAAQERAGAQRGVGSVERSVELGQPVLARDYRPRADKWAHGKVIARETPVTYRIRVSSGQEWKRHIDQLITPGRRGTRFSLSPSETPSEPNQEEPTDTILETAQSTQSDTINSNAELESLDSNNTCIVESPKPVLQLPTQDLNIRYERPKRSCRIKKIH